MMKKYVLIYCMISFYFFPLILEAGIQTSQTDSLIQVAEKLIEKNDIDAAHKIYEKVLRIEKNSIPALVALGEIYAAREDWGTAKSYFNRILKLIPNHLTANYYLGICFRETGKSKALFFRKRDWDASERYFRSVLVKDSLFLDTFYQYARLLRYRKKYREAIIAAHAQIEARPDLTEPKVKIFRFYRYLISHTNLEEIINWLRDQTWDHSRYFIGEMYRRNGMLFKADSIFQNLLQQNLDMPMIPIFLSLARIKYEQNKPENGEELFWSAVAQIQTPVEADLVFEDIKYILRDVELNKYMALRDNKEKIEFFQNVWITRNPIPARTLNVRLSEHYRRLLFAEKYYEFDGFRLWHTNPDKLKELEFPQINSLNQEFNDKGLIYLRHGEPNDKIVTPGQDIPSNESWLYYQTNFLPQMTFHFIMGDPQNGWLFSPIIRNPEMLRDRIQWGSTYYRLLTSNALELLTHEQDLVEESRASVTIGLTTDRHTWEKNIEPLNVAASLDAFRGEDGKTSLEFAYSIPLEKLLELSEKKNLNLQVERGIAIHQKEPLLFTRLCDTLIFKERNSKFFIGFYRLNLSPSMYDIGFHAKSLDFNFLGSLKYKKEVENFFIDGLNISDIQLASLIEPASFKTEFVKNGLLVVPNPNHNFSRENPLYLYFEIYHLTQNSKNQTIYTVEYELSSVKQQKKQLGNLFGLLGENKEYSVTIQNEREGEGEFSVEYMAIDISKTKPGLYDLNVKVTDQIKGMSIQRTNAIIIQ